ncbi:HupE/UreJ family protein [Acaryochloris sp. IP29b_bin.137]|uniref:HupE/UreJ family protein n=1 Tax=Acaryochloris sp. IP29b_bin.137 TaxID=2969217 RepID=UPI002608B813|nr:HupE/UreJ family protein [Acaryochloris sp. IP29b_bin.137]
MNKILRSLRSLDRSTRLSQRLLPLLLLGIVLVPVSAQAHFEGSHSLGFFHGLAHPISGVDHLAAMVAVGLWATQLGRRAFWAVPLTFVAVMILGGLMGTTGFTIPFIEQGIAYSVLMLGALITAAICLPLSQSAGIVALFALYHGYAHGAEMPASASGLSYGLGFVVTTALLHLSGIGLGLVCQQVFQRHARLAQLFMGGLVTSVGVYLCVA